MNDNSTILQKIKDNAFYIALGVGILAIIALIAVYTMGRDGGINEVNDINLNQPSDYSSLNSDTDRAGDKSTRSVNESSRVNNARNNKQTVENRPNTDTTENTQNNNSVNDKAITGENDTGNNGATIAENTDSVTNNASDDGEQLPVTADVGELNFGSGKTLAWPVSGEVILPYSMETTVYYKTLDQYRTNPGMLIAAGSGSTVKNAYLGKVVKVTSDNTYGNLVTIYLGNDYSVVYGQLDTIYVKEGDVVKAGESVGTIGKPTDAFEDEGSHLFFELKKGDTPVDPMEFMQ